MRIFRSYWHWLIAFTGTAVLIAVLFWLYLNIQASLKVSAQQADIELSHSLPTVIHVGNYLETHAKGGLNTSIALDRKLSLPLQGKYLANLAFSVEVPITVNLDYETPLRIKQNMPLEATTDLIYQNKLLPKFPLKLNIPIDLEVPFRIQRQYTVPVKIVFNGPVYFDFNEPVHLHVRHAISPQLNINDPMTMRKVAAFHATMYNTERNSKANLDMQMNVPLKNIHP